VPLSIPVLLTRRLATLAIGLVIALAALLSAPRPALAYGVATHAWLAEEEANRLAAADPRLAFLVTDPEARACFLYGAIFPDMRSIARQVASFAPLKAQVLSTGFVASVKFSTDGVDTALANIDTHDCAWLLLLVDRAEASGDRMKHAFALGNLAHVMQDKYSQIVQIPERVQHLHCGDLGVEPAHDPAALGSWHPGVENELWFDGTGDFARPRANVMFVKDAPWRLGANPTVSYQRALALRKFWWQTAVGFITQSGRTPPSEQSVLNAAQLFELSLTFYGFFTGNEQIGDALRSFIDRYLVLHWWASALNGVVQAISVNLTSGGDVFAVFGPIAQPFVGRQVGGRSVTGEILYASAQGGAEWARVLAKYAANPEFARLQASGLVDRATYAGMDYETAHAFAMDGLTRRGLSQFTDDAIWPRYSRRVMRASVVRSLLRASGADGVAEAPALLLWDLRAVDRATGAPFPEVRIPADQGKTLRVEVEMLGANDRPEARIVRVRLRADVGAGPAGDPVLASKTTIVPASTLALTSYGSIARPVVAAEWTIADVPGAAGVYFEVDERRLSPTKDEGAVDALFTTHPGAIAPLMQGRAHYAAHYGMYDKDMSSLRIVR